MKSLTTAVDSGTVLYGVIGDPVRHSRSPFMLNRAFQDSGLNAVYAAFHVTPEQLESAVRGARALQFGGLNVTIPHKVGVMSFLDEIDAGARLIGAVNTIVNDGGKLVGYNTDGIGYVRSLKEEAAGSVVGKRVLVIGAGGAARGVVHALAKEKPAVLWIANRTQEKAAGLADMLAGPARVEALPLEQISRTCQDADIVINTTGAGMYPQTEEVPIDTSWFHPGLIVSDIIYTPAKTRLLREAEAKGAAVHGGLGMFVYQGAYAFEFWTGKEAPIEAMREAAERSLDQLQNGIGFRTGGKGDHLCESG